MHTGKPLPGQFAVWAMMSRLNKQSSAYLHGRKIHHCIKNTLWLSVVPPRTRRMKIDGEGRRVPGVWVACNVRLNFLSLPQCFISRHFCLWMERVLSAGAPCACCAARSVTGSFIRLGGAASWCDTSRTCQTVRRASVSSLWGGVSHKLLIPDLPLLPPPSGEYCSRLFHLKK